MGYLVVKANGQVVCHGKRAYIDPTKLDSYES